ncbi:hypothetical protein A2419_00420 [Candidatus Adlerbacteria bacterium RIFOXYC1_FULL_48_26]|uniref:Uncharacterized protein n=1 Tax=Candidatus Adlerbacteria bacterium RIFOXYC1_FULL_48_26 TaxID=1797247 RepID=A0A1F4Y4U7_9BACT|nr:MAG: hypothetical protein A2419_00420 [Candidatus Adlerbacteria bacterium RIFOXYC1_FULL_48_26]OGC93512.1 MAG: hypothetical protein A2389_03040 [Candidatus Adlerbacteria bacterium RIFOXYB1_FULL_48_10]
MPSNTQLIARVKVDRRFSGDIACELRKRFPKYEKYERLPAAGKDDVTHLLEFTVDEKDAKVFFTLHQRMGPHRGELMFYRPEVIPEAVAA